MSFVQLHGGYTVTFRAKGTGGSNLLTVSAARLMSNASENFLNQTVTLTPSWADYTLTFQAAETGQIGPVQLNFSVSGASVLLDDVAFAETSDSDNPTVFRNAVVSTLQSLQPGILRYMDSDDFGSSLDNMLMPQQGRTRSGYSAWYTEQDQIPVGLHDFLVLCQTVGAEPWYTLQPGMTTQEMSNLMDYLGGSTSTVYGARRAALGQSAPWTSVFKTIHLEFGNEVWNGIFGGANMSDEVGYGSRAAVLFGTARASASFSPAAFDLILDGWAAVPYWNQLVLASSANYDSIDVAPYLFNSFNNASSSEAEFGPMFAQPELFDSTAGGQMQLQAATAAAATTPAKLAVYETNLSANQGTASQSAVNAVVPSVGAGIVATEHMLLMMRDLGIVNQNMYALTGYNNSFTNPNVAGESTPLWGSVVDMGNTNRLRPSFLAEQLANRAILPNLLLTTQTGANPTWSQPLSTNDNIGPIVAHDIQSVAFTDGSTSNVVVFNLSRTQALPISFSGPQAPVGNVAVQTLTSANITDDNETDATVATANSSLTLAAGQNVTLPPFSMTVFSSAAPSVTGVSVSCPQTTVIASGSTQCSATVSGTADQAVNWSASAGSVSSAGVFTAPSTTAAGATSTIVATSQADPTVSGTTVITLAAPSTVTAVVVDCPKSSIAALSTLTCSARVSGTGSFSSAVQWKITAGSINQNGDVTADSKAGTLKITAASVQTPSISGTASVKVVKAKTSPTKSK